MAVQRVFITGIKRIDKKLKLLPQAVQKKIIRPAIREGLKLVKAEAAMRAAVDTGRMKKALKIVAYKKRKVGRIGMNLQISTSVPGLVKHSKSGKRAFYPAVEEYGARDHPPDPFMRPAFTGAGPSARDLTMQKILDGIEREAMKP
jgi:HK97 gp10 family phage protein